MCGRPDPPSGIGDKTKALVGIEALGVLETDVAYVTTLSIAALYAGAFPKEAVSGFRPYHHPH
jgi:hypothetical protein